MAETLLSFSDIELFGVELAGLKIEDPDPEIVVHHVVESDTPKLEGHFESDGVYFGRGQKVLVLGPQKTLNGVYELLGPDEKWRLVELDKGSIIAFHSLSARGSRQPRRFKIEAGFEAFTRAHCTVSISRKVEKDSASLNSLTAYLGGETINLLDLPSGGSIDIGTNAVLNARNIAASINSKLGDSFDARISGDAVMILAPAWAGGTANGWDVKVDGENVEIDPDPAEFKGGVSQKATFTPARMQGEGKGPHNRRRGRNGQLQLQLHNDDARFARIYGFAYEGGYYDLPRPTLFLVHGEGELVTRPDEGRPQDARAPRSSALTGLASAGFDFADDLKVWSYDEADYTIRMDVETGMFERVLLEAMFDPDSERIPQAKGMHARGMHARGMHARGMHARGMHARGMHARGGNSD